MTPLEATELVYETARTGLGAAGVTYTFDGERFEPPADTAWVRVTVRDLPTAGATHGPAGGRRARRRGVVAAQCFAPNYPDDGAGAALALAQQVRALFEGKDIPSTPGVEPINFDAATVRRIGADGAWYQAHAEIPFTFDETF